MGFAICVCALSAAMLMMGEFTMAQGSVTTSPAFDPCHSYTVLNDAWRATTNQNQSVIRCDRNVQWQGWYRMFHQGASVLMPNVCVPDQRCGTHAPLWLNGPHARPGEGIVTREVCGHWNGDCCHFKSTSIQVKACPGSYTVYKLVKPLNCNLAYCTDETATPAAVTTPAPTTPDPTTTTTAAATSPAPTTPAVVDPCEELYCTEDEWCGQKDGVYGCLCNEDHPRPYAESYDSVEYCSSSTGTMSLSRCQLFEEGFSAIALHLNDPSCNGTLQDGRVEFLFDNENHTCGTTLRSNSTHFIYENLIQGEANSAGGPISRERRIQLLFCCVYPLTQALSMDMDINPLESVVTKKLPGGQGTYRVRMIPYEDAGFSNAFSGNVTVAVNQRMYVAVRLDGVDSRQIALVMDSCWATPVNQADYHIRWDLIRNECPNPDDDTVELLQNGNSTSGRFSFKMFFFVANTSKVYLHCSIHLCLVASNDCTAHCYPGYPQRKRRSVDFHDSASISLGPLVGPVAEQMGET